MKKDTIILILKGFFFLILGIPFLRFAILLFTSIHPWYFILPFALAFLFSSLYLFTQSLNCFNKALLEYQDSKLLFGIQRILYKLDELYQILPKYFIKIYQINFLCFWFGIVIWQIIVSVQNGSFQNILFLIPFLLCGIFIFYHVMIKKK